MKFLVDEHLSPRLATLLAGAGHDATHVATIGLAAAADVDILAAAADAGAVIVSADTDFAALLAQAHLGAPSVVLFRRLGGR